MVYLILAAVAFIVGYWARYRTAGIDDSKRAVAYLVGLREDGKIDKEAANRLVLLVRDERKKIREEERKRLVRGAQ